MKRLLASIIDQIITVGVGALVCLLASLILKVIGFEFEYVLITYIAFIAVAEILYLPIVESTKLRTSIGKKLLNV